MISRWHHSQGTPKAKDAKAAKIQADVKARAAREVAQMMRYSRRVVGSHQKSNLYAAGAKNVATPSATSSASPSGSEQRQEPFTTTSVARKMGAFPASVGSDAVFGLLISV